MQNSKRSLFFWLLKQLDNYSVYHTKISFLLPSVDETLIDQGRNYDCCTGTLEETFITIDDTVNPPDKWIIDRVFAPNYMKVRKDKRMKFQATDYLLLIVMDEQMSQMHKFVFNVNGDVHRAYDHPCEICEFYFEVNTSCVHCKEINEQNEKECNERENKKAKCSSPFGEIGRKPKPLFGDSDFPPLK